MKDWRKGAELELARGGVHSRFCTGEGGETIVSTEIWLLGVVQQPWLQGSGVCWWNGCILLLRARVYELLTCLLWQNVCITFSNLKSDSVFQNMLKDNAIIMEAVSNKKQLVFWVTNVLFLCFRLTSLAPSEEVISALRGWLLLNKSVIARAPSACLRLLSRIRCGGSS